MHRLADSGWEEPLAPPAARRSGGATRRDRSPQSTTGRTLVGASVAGLLIAALFTAWSLVADTASAPREIVLVARGMAFYLPGDERPNPPLRFRPGERVRLVLKNDDPGFVHNFAVPAWTVTMRKLKSGEVGAVEFLVPEEVGRYEYRCTPHGQMMRGTIDVTAAF